MTFFKIGIMNNLKFNRESLARSVKKYTDDYHEYFLEWLFEKPIVTSSETIDDLKAAGLQGMKTAYVHRPFEYGREKLFDLAEVDDYKGDRDWDIVSADFHDLANQLGC